MLCDLSAPLDYGELFGRSGPVEMEIGAGRGDFILGYAQQNPETNFLAVERKEVVLKRMANKLGHAGVQNVQVLNVEILHFMEHYIPAHSLQAIHIYFPDPWPKNPHAKRRLIQAANLQLLLRGLIPGGFVHFRTDHPKYNRDAMQVFAGFTSLQPTEIPSGLLEVTTGFERRFLSQGIDIHRSTFVYRP